MSINPAQAHAQMHTAATYAPPVIRPASPASSVGTTYGPDATSYSDSEYELTQPSFEKKYQERLGLTGEKRREEEIAEQDPLLTIPRGAGPPVGIRERKMDILEEKILFERVMQNLKAEVQLLRENELFERILLRGSRVGMEQPPPTTNIDAIMSSMMGPSLNLNAPTHPPSRPMHTNTNPKPHNHAPSQKGRLQINPTGPDVTPGPWNNFGKGFGPTIPDSEGESGTAMDISGASESTMTPPQAEVGGKRSRNGTSRSKRRV